MKSRINIFYLFAIILFLVSCDDYLDIKPKGELLPETVADYEKMLNYHQLLKASDTYPIFLTDDAFIPEKIADNGYLGLDQVDPFVRNLYTFQNEVFTEAETDDLWVQSYNRIYYYNVVAERVLDATEATKEEKLSIRAEALMGRAFEYLILVNAYAKHYDAQTAATDLAVPLVLDEDVNKENLKRATVKEVYEQIQKDLKEAAQYLPEEPKLNAFRASKPVGLGMLARMNLYLGNYEEALKNANASMAKNNTLLDLKKYNITNENYYIGRLDVPDKDQNPENIYIRLAPWVFAPSMSVFVSEDLQKLYDKENDKRFLLYTTNTPPQVQLPEGQYIWFPWLYTNMAMSTPEMYLIAAECEARIGSKERAMELINTLRDNRIMNNQPLMADSNEDALVKVLEERRRELAMVGLTRLIDLKRLNKDPRFAKTITHTVGTETYTLEPESPKYVFPIPREVLKFNPDMKQNPR